jgi:hypothetical protein
MGRRNKINGQMAFAAIQGKDGDSYGYTHFLSMDEDLGITETEDLKKAKEIYRVYMESNDIPKHVKVLSLMEEAISQVRSREMVSTEIKLSVQSNYVYARSTFYRRRFEPNDIRTIIGRTDIVGDDVNKLTEDLVFMTKAISQLKEVMNDEIKQTLDDLKSIIINE